MMDEPKPKAKKEENLVLYYVYLAVACAGLGTGITVLLILFCQYYEIDIMKNLWLLAGGRSMAGASAVNSKSATATHQTAQDLTLVF